MNRIIKNHPGNCIPTSSQCVIWEGGKICCVEICSNDTISDVIRKMGETICSLVNQLDLSELDYKCLVGEGDSLPAKKLISVLQLIIDKHCTLEEAVQSLTTRVENIEDTIENYNNPVYDLPPQYQQGEGTTLDQTSYINLIGERTGSSFEDIASLEQGLNNLGEQLAELSANIPDPTPIPQIVVPDIMGDNLPHEVQDVVIELSQQYTETSDNLGSPSEMAEVCLSQTSSLNTEQSLSLPDRQMQDLSGWSSIPNNISKSLKNMWITILDMRESLKDLIPPPSTGCGVIDYEFGAKLDGEQGILVIYLFGYSTIPNTFSDCDPTGSTITITDELGNIFSSKIITSDYIENSLGYYIDINNSPLDVTLDMEVSIDYCLTNGSDTCTGNSTKVVSNSLKKCCPITTYVNGDLLTVTFNPKHPQATYSLNLSGNNQYNNTSTFVEPSGSVVTQFTQLSNGTYTLTLTVSIPQVFEVDCSPITININ